MPLKSSQFKLLVMQSFTLWEVGQCNSAQNQEARVCTTHIDERAYLELLVIWDVVELNVQPLIHLCLELFHVLNHK